MSRDLFEPESCWCRETIRRRVDTYFDTESFRFHGPDMFNAHYAGLAAYFGSIRAAFDDRSIRRGIIVVEGLTVACQT